MDPGSGAFLTPGSGSRNRFFQDPGSRIPDLGSRILNPYFLELSDNFLGKKFYNSLKTDPNFILQHFKNKIIFNVMKFVATKKGMTTIFSPSLLLLFLDPGSGWVKIRIRDPGQISGIRNTGNSDSFLAWFRSWRSVEYLWCKCTQAGNLSEAEFLDVIGTWEKSLKGSDQWETRGVGMVPNDRYWSLTAVVLLIISVNGKVRQGNLTIFYAFQYLLAYLGRQCWCRWEF